MQHHLPGDSNEWLPTGSAQYHSLGLLMVFSSTSAVYIEHRDTTAAVDNFKKHLKNRKVECRRFVFEYVKGITFIILV